MFRDYISTSGYKKNLVCLEKNLYEYKNCSVNLVKMGVRGLVAFMKSQPAFIEKHRLRDTKLVIDANNLYHFIYFNYYVPFKCGGDYHLFAAKIKLFFQMFQKCGISVYLVFDGGYETDQKKLKTCLQRACQRIHNARTIARGKSGRVTPSFALDTFKFVLAEIGIPFVVGDFEADNQIATLANEWGCPVLSNDSDFFIYSLEGGFVLLDNLDLTVKSVKDETTDKTIFFLDCEMYHFRNFVKVFPGLNTEMLPLLSTVCGNDYVKNQNMFLNFFVNLSRAPDDFGTQIFARKHNTLFLSLLYWMKNQSSVPEAINNIVHFLKKTNRHRLGKLMRTSVKVYQTGKSSFSLKDFFEKNQLEFSTEGAKKFFKGNPLPTWFLESLKRGEVPVFFLNTLRLRRHILLCQVENLDSESSHLCSRYIRQVIYGILLLHDIDRWPPLKQSIEEFDRSGMNYQKCRVKSIFKLENFGPLPALNDIATAPLDVRKQIVLSTLGVSLDFLEAFPVELKLVASTIVYWVKNSSPEIKKVMVSCVIACSLYLWAKIFRKYTIKQKASLTVTDQPSLEKLLLECEKKDLDVVANNLGKMCGLPSEDYKKSIDIVTVHSFNQFQSCLCYAIYLNSLLLKPFVAPRPHLVFCGTFLDNIFHDVHHRSNPQERIAEAFGSDSVLGQLFVTLDEAFHSLLESCYQIKGQKKKRKTGRKHRRSEKIPCGNAINSIEKADIDDDDEEIDVMCDVENRFTNLQVADSLSH